MQGALSYLWYEAAYWISAVGMGFGFSLRAEGGRHVPRTGPALLIANHQSFLDPLLAGLAARRHLCFLARRTLYRNRAFGGLLRSLNAVPIDQEGFARQGLQTILEQLRAGRAVLIFPEGERTANGSLRPLRPGIHLLIKRVPMPIVPIGIAGAYEAWPRWRRLPAPVPLFWPTGKGTVAVAIGRPLDSRRFADLPREAALAALFAELRKVVDRAERLRQNL